MACQLIGELLSSGMAMRVVGGATGADVDIVVPATELPRLRVALEAIGTPEIPTLKRLLEGRPCRVLTALGPLDVFVEEPWRS